MFGSNQHASRFSVWPSVAVYKVSQAIICLSFKAFSNDFSTSRQVKMVDATDRLVQKIVEDDRPIATRKKRRRSTVSTGDSPHKNVVDHLFESTISAPKTPGKIKKRVRFSDPGPAVSSPHSTGITPFFQKTALHPDDTVILQTPRGRGRPRKCASLPSISPPEASSPIEIQFASMRQILTPRTKRQLGRSRLSEEMNKIEDEKNEKKVQFKLQQKIDDLQDELEIARSQGCRSDNALTDGSARIQQLEKEVEELKRELQDSQPVASDFGLNSDHGDGMSSISGGIYEDPDSIQANTTPDTSTIPSTATGLIARTVDQVSQTEVVPSSVPELEDHIKTQTAHLLQARLDLERLHPGETSLPLTPPANGDCSPLLTAMLEHLRSTQATIQSTKSSLRASEAQESNLRAQFNGVLASLDTTREAHAHLLKGAKAGAEKYAQARERIISLEGELDESNRSSEKLKMALNSYREEVKSLEALVTRIEQEGKEKLEALNYEKDEAVADLECWVAAETRGRREAEEQVDARALQIRILEGTEKELKEALSEKQQLIRTLEYELEQAQTGREDEVGRLNVKIGNIEEAMVTLNVDIKKLEKEKASLKKAVLDGKQSEMKAVATLKGELRKAVRGVEGVVGGWEKDASRRAEVVKTGGLLTPVVEGGRFRDAVMDNIEGNVEMKRGNSRRSIDSGIGMFEDLGSEQ